MISFVIYRPSTSSTNMQPPHKQICHLNNSFFFFNLMKRLIFFPVALIATPSSSCDGFFHLLYANNFSA